MDRLFRALADAARQDQPAALGIISGVKGSSPQKEGAKAVFYPDGSICGTLGGGCLEAEIQHRALNALRTGRPETFDLLLDDDFGWDDGLVCGGKVTGLIVPRPGKAGASFWDTLAKREEAVAWGVREDFTIGLTDPDAAAGRSEGWLFHERVDPPCALWIAGAGHVAQAVARLAVQLDFVVTVFDDRPALASRGYFAEPIRLRADGWERLLAEPFPLAPAYGLITTRGHRHDALVLRDWIHRPFRFLGMIGSARKARTIRDYFVEEQIATPEQLEQVECPVGVKIRSRTVPEIAVSIVARYIDKRAESRGSV